jgi:hypothetical protein
VVATGAAETASSGGGGGGGGPGFSLDFSKLHPPSPGEEAEGEAAGFHNNSDDEVRRQSARMSQRQSAATAEEQEIETKIKRLETQLKAKKIQRQVFFFFFLFCVHTLLNNTPNSKVDAPSIE